MYGYYYNNDCDDNMEALNTYLYASESQYLQRGGHFYIITKNRNNVYVMRRIADDTRSGRPTKKPENPYSRVIERVRVKEEGGKPDQLLTNFGRDKYVPYNVVKDKSVISLLGFLA